MKVRGWTGKRQRICKLRKQTERRTEFKSLYPIKQNISVGDRNDILAVISINPLTPNDPYRGRTAPLTSKRYILYIYSTNIGTEYFKHGVYSPFFPPLQNAVCFIILTYLVPVLFTFYIQGVLKLKKNNSGAKSLRLQCSGK